MHQIKRFLPTLKGYGPLSLYPLSFQVQFLILSIRIPCPCHSNSQDRAQHPTVLPPYALSCLLLFSCQVMPNSLDPMDCRMPGFPVLPRLLEFSQVHVHCIQPSHPLPPSSAFNLSQHQGLFQWVSCLYQGAKVLLTFLIPRLDCQHLDNGIMSCVSLHFQGLS